MVKKSQVAVQKSPAEFFAENQNIAGFDSTEKALYTTVRELVENSLDAAESIRVLPEINLTIVELSKKQLDEMKGFESGDKVDMDLYSEKKSAKKRGGKRKEPAKVTEDGVDAGEAEEEQQEDSNKGRKSGDKYYKIICEDNGCGMQHKQVPEMFGRVLSGSKYGVKQARGKFGLGAKMALIWAKKSTGVPIEITTAHSSDPDEPASKETYCKLDIDMRKNEPNPKVHILRDCAKKWRGTKIEIVISGGRLAKVKQYMKLLAVITPYADFRFRFQNPSDPKKSFEIRYDRRSTTMCDPPKEVKYHPKSVDNLIVRHLLEKAKKGNKNPTLKDFLTKQFSSIKPALAERLVEEYQSLIKFTGRTKGKALHCQDLSQQQEDQLTHLLRETNVFPDPSASCLSPANEYNLRLGVQKEFSPEMIATAVSKPGAYGGHPFIVEAALALGGTASKAGISLFRFANRIPLLFEQGNDVMHVVANKQFNWKQYLMDPKADKIGVFISIVSTKIPFKGTGKEYIGADIEPIRNAVLYALRECAKQLRSKLQERRKTKDRENKANNLLRYVPNVSQAILKVVNLMHQTLENSKKRQREGHAEEAHGDAMTQVHDRRDAVAKRLKVLEQTYLKAEGLSTTALEKQLQHAIEAVALSDAMELVKSRGRGKAEKTTMFLVPNPSPQLSFGPEHVHPLLTFRFFHRANITNNSN